MMTNGGENRRGCLRVSLLTYMSEAAPSVWVQQMPQFYISKTLSKCLFFHCQKKVSFSRLHRAEDQIPQKTEESEGKTLYITSFSFDSSVPRMRV